MRKAKCVICGKRFLTHRKTIKISCSIRCRSKRHRIAMAGRVGENSSNWKGGSCVIGGRKYIYMPLSDMLSKKRVHVNEARLIMSKIIGRKLKNGNNREVVHHVDGNKLNNEPSNLLLMTNSEHSRLHATKPSVNTTKRRIFGLKLAWKNRKNFI